MLVLKDCPCLPGSLKPELTCTDLNDPFRRSRMDGRVRIYNDSAIHTVDTGCGLNLEVLTKIPLGIDGYQIYRVGQPTQLTN